MSTGLIAGVVADWDFRQNVTLTGSGISLVKDQSGNGFDVTQTTDAYRLEPPRVPGAASAVQVNEVIGNTFLDLPAGFTLNGNTFTIQFVCEAMNMDVHAQLFICQYIYINTGVDFRAGVQLANGGSSAQMAAIPTSRNVVTYACDDTAADGTGKQYWWIDDWLVATAPAAFNFPASGLSGGTLFANINVTGRYPVTGNLHRMVTYNTCLTPAQIKAQATGQLRTDHRISAGGPNIVCIGDSKTSGLGMSYVNYPWLLAQKFPTSTLFNLGISGWKLVDAIPLISAYLVHVKPGTMNIAVVDMGYNDADLDHTAAATTFANLVTFCNLLRAGGFQKIIVCTSLVRYAGRDDGWNSLVSACNAMIRAGWTGFANALVEFENDPVLSLGLSRRDDIHPGPVGDDQCARLVGNAIVSVLSTGNPGLFPMVSNVISPIL